MKRVRNYMRKDVISFGPHDSIFDVAEILAKENVSGAPVVDGMRIVGMITVSDIIKFMEVRMTISTVMGLEKQSTSLMAFLMIKDEIEHRAKIRELSKTKVADFMTEEVHTISPDSPIIDAAELLEKNKIDRLPVVNEKGRMVGIISRTDLLKALLD